MHVCPRCGYDNIQTARFCQSCGENLSVESTPHAPPQTTAVRYVGFWWRVLGLVVDSAVVSIAIGALATLPGFLLSLVPLSIVAPWVYEALLLSSDWQATVGKMAIGAVVTDEAGGRLSFARASGRHFAKYLSGLVLGIGFLLAAFTEKKQALHDLIAGTVVVRKGR